MNKQKVQTPKFVIQKVPQYFLCLLPRILPRHYPKEH